MTRRQNSVAGVLGLLGPGMWALLALYWATFLVIALVPPGGPMTTWYGDLALCVVLAAATLVVWPGSDPLSLWRVVVILAALVYVNAAIIWQLDPRGWPGFTSWNFGASTFILFALMMRGRAGSAWIGMALVVGITTMWSLITRGEAWHAFNLTYMHVAGVAVCSIFSIGLNRVAARITAFHETERARIAEQVRDMATALQRESDLTQLRAMAGTALESIAAAKTTASDRLEHRIIEAQVRDWLRGRRLIVEPLPTIVADARRQGRSVTLLDDLGEIDLGKESADHIARWAAERVSADDGDVTVRISLVDRAVTTTFVSSAQSERPAALRIELR